MGSIFKAALKAVTRNRGALAGAAAAAGATLAKNILRRPGFSAYFEYQAKKILFGWSEDGPVPEALVRTADSLAGFFSSMQVSLDRIAVDGVPGSGKSSLARALAERLGMGVECLDYQNMDKPLAFDKGRTIYEHHRLLRTQDIDAFDAIIYIDEPVEISMARVLKRKRGGGLVELMDYGKLKAVGEKAFQVADGDAKAIPGSFVKVKVRPGAGFRHRQNIYWELQQKGDGFRNAAGLSTEQALFLLIYGRAGKGFNAYLKKSAFYPELLTALGDSMSRAMKR